MNQILLEQLSVITEEEKEILNGTSDGIAKERYMTREDSVIDSAKLLDAGKLIQIRTHTRFIHFPKHTHNYVEVIYMCQGSTHHIINGDHVILQEGELLFLNQNATQEIYPAGETDIAVNFIILPEFFDHTLRLLDEEESPIRQFIIGCLQSRQESIGYLHFKVADILPIQNLVENLVWTIRHKLPGKRSMNQMTMGLLFLHLLNSTERITVGGDHFEQEMILAIYRYVEEHYKEGELSEFAKAQNMDLANMSRLIKKITGHTYTELVQDKRLTQACFLLEKTKLSVSDIGYDVGYENLSYFHRIFKKRYGVSPKEYRTQY